MKRDTIQIIQIIQYGKMKHGYNKDGMQPMNVDTMQCKRESDGYKTIQGKEINELRYNTIQWKTIQYASIQFITIQ